VQKEAINAIIVGKSSIVAIIPIGRGKSLLFILLAFIEQSSTTIVVILLIALRSNIKQ
jgi:superfamily II DNA helicase RecQ